MPELKRQYFVISILPVVHQYAIGKFRYYDGEEREERVAEATAAAFVAFASLVRRRRDQLVSPLGLAYFAVKHVRNGRHVGGVQDRAKDAMSPKRGAAVIRFAGHHDLPSAFHDALCDNTQSPVPDQVAFRIDFAEFLGKQTKRKREVAKLLALGNQANDVATQIGISPGRVTQIRRELDHEWKILTQE
jgi:hypothetical protein